MVKLILSTGVILISIMALTAQASLEVQERRKNTGIRVIPITPPDDLPSKPDLLPTEEKFKKRCVEEDIEVNWEEARKAFYGAAFYGNIVFRARVRDYTKLSHEVLDDLGLEKLYEEYRDLFICYPPKDATVQPAAIQQTEKLKVLGRPDLDPNFTEHKDNNGDKSVFDLPITDGETDGESDDQSSEGSALLRHRHLVPAL